MKRRYFVVQSELHWCSAQRHLSTEMNDLAEAHRKTFPTILPWLRMTEFLIMQMRKIWKGIARQNKISTPILLLSSMKCGLSLAASHFFPARPRHSARVKCNCREENESAEGFFEFVVFSLFMIVLVAMNGTWVQMLEWKRKVLWLRKNTVYVMFQWNQKGSAALQLKVISAIRFTHGSPLNLWKNIKDKWLA